MCPFALEKRFNTGISAVKNLLLTHPHADHIGGVEELALNSLYVKKSPLNIVISDEFKKSLWKNSLQGGLKYSENGKLGFDDYFVQIKPTKILNKPFEIFQTNIGDIKSSDSTFAYAGGIAGENRGVINNFNVSSQYYVEILKIQNK